MSCRHSIEEQPELNPISQSVMNVMEQLIETMLAVLHARSGAVWMELEHRVYSIVVREMSVHTLHQIHQAAGKTGFSSPSLVEVQGQKFIFSCVGYPLFRVCVAAQVQEMRPSHRQVLPRFAQLVHAVLHSRESPSRMSPEERGYEAYRNIVEHSLRRLGEILQVTGCTLLWFSSWSSRWHRFAVGSVPSSLYQHFWEAPPPGEGLEQWLQALRRSIQCKQQVCLVEELVVRDLMKGCLLLWKDATLGEFTNEEVEWVRITAQMMATSLDVLETQTTLLQRVYHDPLTGVFNRLYFEMAYRQILSSAQRHPRPVSLLMIDIDDFKQINDTYGHEVGDQVLRLLGSVLQHVRAGDVAARYGGDEFVVLLPDTDKQGASALAQRIRSLFSQTVAHHALPLLPSLSIGIATVMNGETSLLLLADQDMYEQKRLEKNPSTVSC